LHLETRAWEGVVGQIITRCRCRKMHVMLTHAAKAIGAANRSGQYSARQYPC
jgi:hypothetical protein